MGQQYLLKLFKGRRIEVPLGKGGQGSGNFGHAGRPGERGGSGEGDGGPSDAPRVRNTDMGEKEAGQPGGGPHTADSLKVTQLDRKKLEADFTKTAFAKFPEQSKNYDRFEIHMPLAIAQANGKTVLMNHEAIGWSREKGDDKPLTISLYGKKDPDASGKGGSFSIVPNFEVRMPAGELLSKFGGKVTSMKEFMGERYGYNSRIQSNEYGMLRHINGK